jgi:hypothetical protein
MKLWAKILDWFEIPVCGFCKKAIFDDEPRETLGKTILHEDCKKELRFKLKMSLLKGGKDERPKLRGVSRL